MEQQLLRGDLPNVAIMTSGLGSNSGCRSTYEGQVGAVASGHPLATDAALATLTAGGNAVDAAIAAAYVLMVVLPEACGIGGDAMALVASGKGDVTSVNGAGLSPAGFAGELRDRRCGYDVDTWRRSHAGQNGNAVWRTVQLKT